MMDNHLKDFIKMNSQEVFVKLKCSEKGLTLTEAKRRLALFGHNDLVEKKIRPVIIDVILHSINPLVGILLIAALIAAFTGSPLNAGIIILIVLISISLDYFQSHRSLAAVKRLQAKVAMTSTVLRNNEWREIPLRDVVPGDVIHLTAGDMVPADAFLLTAKDFYVQEAALTGESFLASPWHSRQKLRIQD